MSKIELSILIILGIVLVWLDYPLWLGICVAAPAIFLTPEGGEKDGCDGIHKKRDQDV